MQHLRIQSAPVLINEKPCYYPSLNDRVGVERNRRRSRLSFLIAENHVTSAHNCNGSTIPVFPTSRSSHRRHPSKMSSLRDIDPLLRGTASTTNTYSQRPTTLSNPNTPNPNIAPAPHHTQYPPIPDGSPHNLYPQTPQSGGNVTDHDHEGDSIRQDDGSNDPKRPRACEACRGLKVRCEPDANNVDGPCKRCNKAGRNCVVTAPSRKRQKKADGRVAELEKKIDALTATLKNAGQSASPLLASGNENGDSMNFARSNSNPYQQVTNGGFASPFVPRPDAVRMQSSEWAGFPKAAEYDGRKPTGPPMVMAGQKRKRLDGRDLPADSRSNHSRQSVDIGSGPQQTAHMATTVPPKKPQTTNEYADVVDRGVVTAEMAGKMFDCYVELMAPHLPAVVFPHGTKAAEVRKNKPTLFLAILAASCGTNYSKLQKQLTKEVMSIYAERIICNGEKTLELIQALQVSTLWYWPPEHFEELKFYQLIHIAAVMAIDIGMGRKSKTTKGPKAAGLWRDNPWRRTPYPDPQTIEARRAWLACYFLCCNASMGLRRPNLIRWNAFMDDCVEVLESSPHALESDKVLCQWIRSQHIAEEVGTQFSMDDPVANVSIADSKVQLSLKGFERDLEKWSNQIPANIASRKSSLIQLKPSNFTPATLKMTKHVVNLYMHEVAMHVDHNVDEFKPPFSEYSLNGNQLNNEVLTPIHIAALSTCLASIDGIFETFLELDAETIRCLPVAHFVRVAYAVVILIKMYFAAAEPNSEFGKVIDTDVMKPEYYLDSLVKVFRAAAADEKSRPSSKFLMVLTMLKTWFHRQRDAKAPPNAQTYGPAKVPVSTTLTDAHTPALTPDVPNSSAENQHQNQQGYASNTPLHVLSEAAAGNQGSSSLPATPGAWNQQAYPNYDPALMNQNMQSFNNVPMGNIDPSLGMDLGYTMGDGFEQAMGMTLGVGDFGGNYLSDDMFFNSLLDSVGGGTGFDGF